jgi:hypothetical protein
MTRMMLMVCALVLLVPGMVAAQDPPKPPPPPAQSPVDVTGVWDMLVESPQGQISVTGTFKQEGEKLTGTQASPMGEVTLEGTVVGAEIKYQIAIDMQGQQMTIVFAGTVDGDTMSGLFDFGGMGTAPWSAKKRQ